MSKKTTTVIQIDIIDLKSNSNNEEIERVCKPKSEIKTTIDLDKSLNHTQKERKRIDKELKSNKQNKERKQSGNKEIESIENTRPQSQKFTSKEKKESKNHKIRYCAAQQNINSLYYICSSPKMTSPSSRDCDSNKRTVNQSSQSAKRNSRIVNGENLKNNIQRKFKASPDSKQYYSQGKDDVDIKLPETLGKRHSEMRPNRLEIREKSREKDNSLNKNKLTICTHRHKSNLSNHMVGQNNSNQIPDLRSQSSRSFASSKVVPNGERETQTSPKYKRLKFSGLYRGSVNQKPKSKKRIEKPNNLSTDIYKCKLTNEFEKVLSHLGLQNNEKANYQDLKMILGLMKMITPNAKCKKWERVLKSVWEILSMSQKKVNFVTIRSIKTFILGICGIDSNTLYEINEQDSTPSASTQESKSSDEFIFTSTEHLNEIRSKFYEMILHKLTFTKDQNDESEHSIKKGGSFHQNIAIKDKINCVEIENKTPTRLKSKNKHA